MLVKILIKEKKKTRKDYLFVILAIDEKDLLSPLLVIQTLGNNESTTLDLLKVNIVFISLIENEFFLLFF